MRTSSSNVFVAPLTTVNTAEDGATAVDYGNSLLGCYWFDMLTIKTNFEVQRVGRGYMQVDKSIRRLEYNYEKIDETGVVRLNTLVQKNDVPVECYGNEKEAQDMSLVYVDDEPSMVTWVNVSAGGQSSERTISVGFRRYMRLTRGNKITQTGNKSMISNVLHPIHAPLTSNGMPINIFNDPISNPRRGLNGTGMIIGQTLSSLVVDGGYDAYDPIPLDISHIRKNNQKVWGNSQGTTTLFLPPHGLLTHHGVNVDCCNIIRAYKH